MHVFKLKDNQMVFCELNFLCVTLLITIKSLKQRKETPFFSNFPYPLSLFTLDISSYLGTTHSNQSEKNIIINGIVNR
jgi:hypothetical protein